MSKKLKTEQVKLQLEVQSNGINIVCCANCDTILLHRINDKHIVCHDCGEHMALNDCCDLYYEDMPNSFPIRDKVKGGMPIQRDAINVWRNSNPNDDYIFYH